jgi:CRP/FNR family transcriptional regulator, cyclic AMP receptor protein
MDMINRFEGRKNRSKRVEAIKKQAIVRNDDALANLIESRTELIEYDTNATIINQGDHDDDLYMIFSGRVSVRVNGREIDIMGPNDHFGEMVVIEPNATRSASVVALENSVVGKIAERDFSRFAERFPFLWREIARGLGSRLRARHELVEQINPRPVVFIGSSSESKEIVHTMQAAFRRDDVVIRPWTKEGIFSASHFPIEDLEFEVQSSDFAILVLGPDDRVVSRSKSYSAPRDNVIFELGLFMGSLSRQRTFLVMPDGLDIKIPSDLLGLTVLRYPKGATRSLSTRLRPVCKQLRTAFSHKGPK